MKIRNGFVSNSSSSSFVIGFKKNLSDEEKEQLLLKKMKINENSFFYNVAKEIIYCIINSEFITNRKKLVEYRYCNSFEEMKESESWFTNAFLKCEEKNFDCYIGSAVNDAENVGEILFCDMEWNINDDNDIFIQKDASF